MRPAALALAVALAAACGEEVDPDVVGRIDDYATWTKAFETFGPVPGHGDSYRIVYVNDVALTYTHGGRYPAGTILAKEIRARRDEDGLVLPGDLNYVGVMRKWDDDAPDPGVPVEGGWIFTYFEGSPGGSETYRSLCWANCHVQGPWDGAWFDYAALVEQLGPE